RSRSNGRSPPACAPSAIWSCCSRLPPAAPIRSSREEWSASSASTRRASPATGAIGAWRSRRPKSCVKSFNDELVLPSRRADVGCGPRPLWRLGGADLVSRGSDVVDRRAARHLPRRVAFLAAARGDPLFSLGAQVVALGRGDAAARPVVAVSALLR